MEYLLRRLAEMKFGVLVGIMVYFVGVGVATVAVFVAGYVALFFLGMDLWRLVGGVGRGREGQGEIVQLEDMGARLVFEGEDDMEEGRPRAS